MKCEYKLKKNDEILVIDVMAESEKSCYQIFRENHYDKLYDGYKIDTYSRFVGNKKEETVRMKAGTLSELRKTVEENILWTKIYG